MSAKKKEKKVPPINFIVHLHVYPFDVMVSIGQSDIELGKSLDKYFPKSLSEHNINLCRYESDTVKGRAVMFNTNASLIRLRELPRGAVQFGQLAHEVFHIVTFVMERIGMELVVVKSCEAYAYLIEYLTTQIYKQTNKYY